MEASEPARVQYSEEDRKLLRDTVFNGVPEFQYRQGWHIVETWGIDLFMPGQFYVTPRKSKSGGTRYQFTVGHPVMLRIAHELGMKTLHHNLEYEPADTRKEHPISDTVQITRFDDAEFSKPTYFSDYYTKGSMWDSMPHVMLEKCAEAATIRIAFKLYGLYIREEMMKDDSSDQAADYDPDAPIYTPDQVKSVRENVEFRFPGQTITDGEAAECRRKDGNYDKAAVDRLFMKKRDAFEGEKKANV